MESEPRAVLACVDAPQLIKHTIALRRRELPFEFLLLWYSPPPETAEADEMLGEIERFTAIARADGVQFRAMTYQDVFRRLGEVAGMGEHAAYLGYLKERYFA